jgi:hypothetical protein
MATPVGQQQTAKELFYSYSHKDAELREELERHLSILKRSGIVQGWHDRAIDAGAEWAGQIDEHLGKADIILLLISADFLASDYCYDIEMKRALARHEAGEAIVIPVILRPVDWSGAPFAKLQCLPTHAVPVTSWANRDEAFRDVAEGIRHAILKAARPPDTELQERAVDAAMPSTVPVGSSAALLVMVRRTTSSGLRAVLRVDDAYEIYEKDVRSKAFQMEFSRNERDQLVPEVLTVRIESNDFDVPCAGKQIAVPPHGDSDTCVFLVAARHPGRLQLLVEVLHEHVTVASHLLRMSAAELAPAHEPALYVLAVLPLTVYARHARQSPGEFTRMFGSPAAPSTLPTATGPGEFTRMFQSPAAPSAPPAATGPDDSTRISAPTAVVLSEPVGKSSSRRLSLTLGAVAVLVVGILYFLIWR